MTTQTAHLTRCRSAIGDHVKQFCADRIDNTFYASELVAYVSQQVPCAPSSPTRILQDLRVRGEIQYTLLDRRRSVYLVNGVSV